MTATQYTALSAAQTYPAALSSELRTKLWSMILVRLNSGQALITDQDFRAALEEDYQDLTGIAPPPEIKKRISRMVAAVNETHPETYRAQGVQNGINRAFESGVRRLKWDLAKIQEKGVPAVRRFRRQNSVRSLLREINIRTVEIDVIACVKRAIAAVGGQSRTSPVSPALPSPTAISSRLALESPGPSAPATPAPSPVVDPELQAAIEEGEVDQTEVVQRQRQQEHQRVKLEQRELEKLPDHLPSYVDRGLLTEEEASAFEQLH